MSRVIISGIVGMVFIAFGINIHLQQLNEQRWVRTNGEITLANISYLKAKEKNIRFRPTIRYKYTVAGIEYVGSTIFLNESNLFSEDQLFDILGGYVEEEIVRVYYDPDKPKLSALFLSSSNNNSEYMFIFGAIILAFGIFIHPICTGIKFIILIFKRVVLRRF